MSRCVAFLNALSSLPAEEWRVRAANDATRTNPARAAIRAELERRCDALELWDLRDDVNTLCWRLPPAERARLREMIADAALAILAGVPADYAQAAELLAGFADLVPGERSLTSETRSP